MNDLEKSRKQVEDEVIDIAFFMKGGVTYFESWQLSQLQRLSIIERVNKHNKDMYGGKDYL